MAEYLAHGDLVAGASAIGHGVLTGWHGRGDMVRERLLDIAALADVPRDWLPSVKDAGVQLGRAVQAVAGTAYLAKPVRKGPVQEGQGPITWDARWVLVTRPTGQDELTPGQRYGTVALQATLYMGDTGPVLSFERDQSDPRTLSLATAVEGHFESRIAQQRYTAADVTKWLGDTLRRRLGAVRYGGNWYIPRETRAIAEVLMATVRESGWGTNWMYPALPIASTAELSTGLAISFQGEVADVMQQLSQARAYAQGEGRTDIGPRATDSYQARFQEVYDRAKSYHARGLLTDEALGSVDPLIADAMVLLDSIRETHALEDKAPTGPSFDDDDLSRYDNA